MSVAIVLLLGALVVVGSLAWAAGWQMLTELFGPAPEALVNDPLEVTRFALFVLGGALAVFGLGLTAWRHQLERERLADERQRETTRQKEVAEDRKERHDQEVRRLDELREDREEVRERDSAARTAREADRRDAREAELRARYVSILELLQDGDSVTRTAGVYALGALADDWARLGSTAERQVCIDLLLDYIRSESRAEDVEIRRTAFRVVQMHLQRDADSGLRVGGSWSDANFNLSGIVLPDELRLDMVLGSVVLDPPTAGKTIEVATVGPTGHLRISGERVPSGMALGEVSVAEVVGGEVSVYDVRGAGATVIAISRMREEASARIGASHVVFSVGSASESKIDAWNLDDGGELRLSEVRASAISVSRSAEVVVVVDGVDQGDCGFLNLTDSQIVLRSIARTKVKLLRSAGNRIELNKPARGNLKYVPEEVLSAWPPQRRGGRELRSNEILIEDALNGVEIVDPDPEFCDLRGRDDSRP